MSNPVVGLGGDLPARRHLHRDVAALVRLQRLHRRRRARWLLLDRRDAEAEPRLRPTGRRDWLAARDQRLALEAADDLAQRRLVLRELGLGRPVKLQRREARRRDDLDRTAQLHAVERRARERRRDVAVGHLVGELERAAGVPDARAERFRELLHQLLGRNVAVAHARGVNERGDQIRRVPRDDQRARRVVDAPPCGAPHRESVVLVVVDGRRAGVGHVIDGGSERLHVLPCGLRRDVFARSASIDWHDARLRRTSSTRMANHVTRNAPFRARQTGHAVRDRALSSARPCARCLWRRQQSTATDQPGGCPASAGFRDTDRLLDPLVGRAPAARRPAHAARILDSSLAAQDADIDVQIRQIEKPEDEETLTPQEQKAHIKQQRYNMAPGQNMKTTPDSQRLHAIRDQNDRAAISKAWALLGKDQQVTAKRILEGHGVQVPGDEKAAPEAIDDGTPLPGMDQ